MLRLTISDDSKGIDPATPKGFGLTTMIERVKSLGGTCAIDSAPGAGTTNGVIAEHLHVSYKTVANICTQLKAKLGVRTLPSATPRPPK